MKLQEQNVLFLTRTMGQGGTENVVLQLCEILKPCVKKILVCSCGGVNVQQLNQMGIEHHLIPDLASKSPTTMLRTFRMLKQIVEDEKITIIHSHHRMAAFYARLVSPKSVIQIANAHNVFHDKKTLTRYSYRKTNLIAVGEQVKKNLIHFYGLDDKQVTVIHNTVKPFEGPTVPVKELELARTDGNILIGNVGRLSEQKGMSYFIHAAVMVYEQCPRARFFIIGDGEERESLKKMAQDCLPPDVISFLGFRSDVQNIMSQLDFLVLSSLWEGFPLTPIEAFSVGKTIVATEVDGTPEIVQDGVNGILVPSGKIAPLAERMLELCRMPEVRKSMEKNAHSQYEQEFSFENMKKTYIQYYQTLLK